jgi:transcriptional regulator with XRE-family HTH domain
MPVKRVRLAAKRKAAGFSQEQLADLLKVSISTVARWESGETAPQPWNRPRLAHLLGISLDQLDELLVEDNASEHAGTEQTALAVPRTSSALQRPAFAAYTRDQETLILPEQSEPVDRREFITASAGAGAAALTGTTALSFLASLEQAAPPATVQPADVAQVSATARFFSGMSHAYGGGVVKGAVIAQLRWAVGLLEADCPERLRPALFYAVGDLNGVCGFMAFDTYAHDDAARMFSFGQSCAVEAGDWHLRARMLVNMSRQATWRGNPEAGLTYIELALVRADRLTARERAWVQASRAQALAHLGRTQETYHAVGQADEAFSDGNVGADPSWMTFYNEAEHAAGTGRALSGLARHGTVQADPGGRLRTAITGYSTAYARSRAMIGVDLAMNLLTHGDPHEGVAVGNQALDDAQGLRSPRALDHLSKLQQAAGTHYGIPEARELVGRITDLRASR